MNLRNDPVVTIMGFVAMTSTAKYCYIVG
jgi:hypothetical protein